MSDLPPYPCFSPYLYLCCWPFPRVLVLLPALTDLELDEVMLQDTLVELPQTRGDGLDTEYDVVFPIPTFPTLLRMSP